MAVVVPFTIHQINETKGRGVIATRKIHVAELIVADLPFVVVPSDGEWNHLSLETYQCAHCFRFVGTLQQQLCHTVRKSLGDFDLPAIDPADAKLSDIKACPAGCNTVAYCSTSCASLAFEQYHKLLCPCRVFSKTHYDKFVEHANATGNARNFQMALKLFAMFFTGAIPHRPAEFVARFCSCPFWDTVLDVPQEELKNELVESLSLLRGIFEPSLLESPLGAELFTLDLYAQLLGALNLNNISVEIVSPLRQYFAAVDALPAKHKARAIAQLAPILRVAVEQLGESNTGESNESGSDEEESDEVLQWKGVPPFSLSRLAPNFEGTGLFPTIALFNHSCAPNASVEFGEDCRATVIAARDITEGEELTISYIPEDWDLETRTTALREYLFKCNCGRCKKEMHENTMQI